MSTLETNTIKPISGSSTLTLGESGDTVSLGTGVTAGTGVGSDGKILISASDTTANYLQSKIVAGNNFSATTAGQYVATLTDVNGCFASDTVDLRDSCNTIRLTMPNVFTPNNDGTNDEFIIQFIEDYEDLSQVTIFNRWGDRVWQSGTFYDNSNPWRGTNQNGTPLADGVYFYSVKLVNASDNYEYVVNGTVTIVDAR